MSNETFLEIFVSILCSKFAASYDFLWVFVFITYWRFTFLGPYTLFQFQRLKIILFKEVQQVCNDSAKAFDMSFSNPAVEIIAELCWKKLKDIGEDLELFAR